jgi:hypothetical protein
MCCGREIEEAKDDLSWQGLHDKFDEFFDYKVNIETDTLKQIFVRAGLTGVGKPGRPVPIQIVTPRNPRCP